MEARVGHAVLDVGEAVAGAEHDLAASNHGDDAARRVGAIGRHHLVDLARGCLGQGLLAEDPDGVLALLVLEGSDRDAVEPGLPGLELDGLGPSGRAVERAHRLSIGIGHRHHDVHARLKGLAEDELALLGGQAVDVGLPRLELVGFLSADGEGRQLLRGRRARAEGRGEDGEEKQAGLHRWGLLANERILARAARAGSRRPLLVSSAAVGPGGSRHGSRSCVAARLRGPLRPCQRPRGRRRPGGGPGSSRPLPPPRAQGLRGPPVVVEQPRPAIERRQPAPDPRRDGRAGGPPGPRRRQPHLAHRRRQRVRLAPPAAPARLLRRLRDPERRRADRRLLRRGPRLRAARALADGARQLGGPLAQQLLADALPQVLPDHGHERGPPPGRQPLLPRGLGEAGLAPRAHALLPRVVPPGPARSARRLALRVPERAREGALRRDRPLGRPGRGRLVRRGGRPLLRGRRGEALDRGHGQRGLLQRRVGASRGRRAVRRRAGGGGHRSRVPHDGLPLAPRGPGALRALAPLRHGARRLDLRRRRLREVGLRRADGPRLERRLLVPGGRSPPISRPSPTAPRGCRRATRPRSRSRRRSARSGRRRARRLSCPTSSGRRT